MRRDPHRERSLALRPRADLHRAEEFPGPVGWWYVPLFWSIALAVAALAWLLS